MCYHCHSGGANITDTAACTSTPLAKRINYFSSQPRSSRKDTVTMNKVRKNENYSIRFIRSSRIATQFGGGMVHEIQWSECVKIFSHIKPDDIITKHPKGNSFVSEKSQTHLSYDGSLQLILCIPSEESQYRMKNALANWTVQIILQFEVVNNKKFKNMFSISNIHFKEPALLI